MNINIKDEYKISSYSHGIKLQRSTRENGKPKKDKEGNVIWESAKYYSDLESIINSIFKQEILYTKATTFKELKKEILDIKKYIKDITKDLKLDVDLEIKKDTK